MIWYKGQTYAHNSFKGLLFLKKKLIQSCIYYFIFPYILLFYIFNLSQMCGSLQCSSLFINMKHLLVVIHVSWFSQVEFHTLEIFAQFKMHIFFLPSSYEECIFNYIFAFKVEKKFFFLGFNFHFLALIILYKMFPVLFINCFLGCIYHLPCFYLLFSTFLIWQVLSCTWTST